MIKKILIISCVVILLIIFGVGLVLNGIVKGTLETVGSKLTGAPLTVGSVNLSLLRGKIKIQDFHLGSPEGFKADSVFSFKTIAISLKPSSLISDKIIIHSILIDAPSLTYEKKLTTSNLKAIINNLEGDAKEEQPAKTTESEDKESSTTQVIIEDFLFKEGKVGLSTAITLGKAISLPLPEIHLTDIGKDKDKPLSLPQSIKLLLNEILKSTLTIAGKSKEFIKGAGSLAKNTAKDTAELTGKGLKKAKSGLKNIFKGKE